MMNELDPIFKELESIDSNQLEKNIAEYFPKISSLISSFINDLSFLQVSPNFWELVPSDKKQSIVRSLRSIYPNIRAIQSFNPMQGGDPQQTIQSITTEITNSYSKLNVDFFFPLKIYRLEQQINSDKYASIGDQAKISLQEIQNQKQEGEKLLAAMKEASEIEGTSQFANIFLKQAALNRNIAIIWLAVLAISAIVIGYFLWVIFNESLDLFKNVKEINYQLSLQFFLSKIILISFFSIIFYQIIKNYNANMHLYTLNKHRENSLKTFQLFVQGSNDPKTKDAVLIQATKSIFDAGDTGFISTKEGSITALETIKIVDQLRER